MELERHIFRSPTYRSVVDEAVGFFVGTPLLPLPLPASFTGTGVYALYYAGDFYRVVCSFELPNGGGLRPIYVGKAVPPGWRTGRTISTKGADVHRRLCEHSRSISEAANLHIENFQCQFAIFSGLEADLIGPTEAELIRRHRPLWNTTIDGFGNHDPGSGRYQQARSEWDVLHPGRKWAERLTGDSPRLEDIIGKIRNRRQ